MEKPVRFSTMPRTATQGDDPYVKLQALERLLDSMTQCPDVGDVRLLLDSRPADGPLNMAVDEALLESVAQGGLPTFRVYGWNEATVSLGYFQRSTPEIEPGGRFHGLPAVRRLSGGGAILHHREITYSCCIPAVHRFSSQPSLLYDEIHRVIQSVLRDFGLRVQPRGAHDGDETKFLCFARGDRRDLVAEGFKIVGSAQRRRHGAILQHGSILLRRSEFAPEFPGILDLARQGLNEPALQHQLLAGAAGLLGSDAREEVLTDDERRLAEQLRREKYSALMPPPANRSE